MNKNDEMKNEEKNADVEKKFQKHINFAINRLYARLESLSWLQSVLTLSYPLPPLNGWPAAPDMLLKLHEEIRSTKPSLIVECGSGATTLVIADALRQNNHGRLISLEHNKYYGQETYRLLQREELNEWVDLNVNDLEIWKGRHLNTEKNSLWYNMDVFSSDLIIDMLIVDGPPGNICKFSRFPAVPALNSKLRSKAIIWLDDFKREEEQQIGEEWACQYDLQMQNINLEKGLAIFIKK